MDLCNLLFLFLLHPKLQCCTMLQYVKSGTNTELIFSNALNLIYDMWYGKAKTGFRSKNSINTFIFPVTKL